MPFWLAWRAGIHCSNCIQHLWSTVPTWSIPLPPCPHTAHPLRTHRLFPTHTPTRLRCWVPTPCDNAGGRSRTFHRCLQPANLLMRCTLPFIERMGAAGIAHGDIEHTAAGGQRFWTETSVSTSAAALGLRVPFPACRVRSFTTSC